MDKPTIAARRPAVLNMEPGTYYWCTCGKSAQQPFCDGSHSGSSFSPIEFKLEQNKQVAFCQCKHSKNPPFCDGAHRTLPA